MSMQERLAAYTALTDARLHELLDGCGAGKLLLDSMAYSLFAGGKRLRPALCMAACALCGGAQEDALDVACALEMIHTYSLIHDDLPAIDNDALRRGKPSNHMVFGEANAILAGDGLLSLALSACAESGRLAATAAVAAGAFGMVAGQSMDVNLAGQADADALHEIHRLKTGALIRASVLGGAYCGVPSGQDVCALSDFADAYGVLFQITDDVLDVTGSNAVLGKTVGKDAAEDKLTYVGLYGLDGAREKAGETAAQALDALSGYGEKADFFRELTDFTLTREK